MILSFQLIKNRTNAIISGAKFYMDTSQMPSSTPPMPPKLEHNNDKSR